MLWLPMAEDAHLPSEPNVRAAAPGDAEYEAMLGAFHETARGRWFLGEYARRNRNADTHMVLTAVERIEATFTAQKQAMAPAAVTSAVVDAVLSTQAAVERIIAKPDTQETLDLIAQSARAIRDISWTLRECGADARICDLIDARVATIGETCERMVTADGDTSTAQVVAAFDDLVRRIAMLANPASTAEHEQASRADDTLHPDARHVIETSAIEDDVVELDDDAYEAMVDATSLAILGDPEDAARPASDAQAFDDLEITDVAVPLAELPAAPAGGESTPDISPRAQETDDAPRSSSSAPLQPAASGGSLGHALIASGIIAHPAAATGDDPLAPLHRMSQADKIAYFT